MCERYVVLLPKWNSANNVDTRLDSLRLCLATRYEMLSQRPELNHAIQTPSRRNLCPVCSRQFWLCV